MVAYDGLLWLKYSIPRPIHLSLHFMESMWYYLACRFAKLGTCSKNGFHISKIYKKLWYRWQNAQHICTNAMAWLPTKTCPSPYVLPYWILSSAVKGVGIINTGKTPKIASSRTLLSWDGRRGWPQDTCPFTTSNLVVLWQRLYAYIEMNPQNWGVLEPCLLWVDAWLTP